MDHRRSLQTDRKWAALAGSTLVLLAGLVAGGCNQDRACLSSAGCEDGFICQQGSCVPADGWSVGADGAVDSDGEMDSAAIDGVETSDRGDAGDGGADGDGPDVGDAAGDAIDGSDGSDDTGGAGDADGSDGADVSDGGDIRESGDVADADTDHTDASNDVGDADTTPSTERNCSDGVDNDGDGKVDCSDADCFSTSACSFSGNESKCDNGLDDDADGRVDCRDPDCSGTSACSKSESNCNNGKDDDGDGLVDCDDGDCAGTTCGHVVEVRGPVGAEFANRGELSRAALANADRYCSRNRDGHWKAVLSTSRISAKSRITIRGNLYNDTSSPDLLDDTGGKRFWDPNRSLKGKIAPNLAVAREVWTGSDRGGGAVSGKTCSDWSASSGKAAVGLVGPTSSSSANYLGGDTGKCANRYRILCVSGQEPENCKQSGDEDDDGVADCRDPSCRFAPHCHQAIDVVGSYLGDFGGVMAADTICGRKAGSSTGPYGNWRAILSVPGTDAKDRIRQTRPFVVSTPPAASRLRVVASPQNRLFSGGLVDNPSYRSRAWTGTTAKGKVSNNHCNGWTAQQAKGSLGNPSVRSSWLQRSFQSTDTCSSTYPIYCISGQ